MPAVEAYKTIWTCLVLVTLVLPNCFLLHHREIDHHFTSGCTAYGSSHLLGFQNSSFGPFKSLDAIILTNYHLGEVLVLWRGLAPGVEQDCFYSQFVNRGFKNGNKLKHRGYYLLTDEWILPAVSWSRVRQSVIHFPCGGDVAFCGSHWNEWPTR